MAPPRSDGNDHDPSSSKRNSDETPSGSPEIDARMAVAITESLPNLKTSTTSKRGDAMEPRIHAASRPINRQKPGVVMKRAELCKSDRIIEPKNNARTHQTLSDGAERRRGFTARESRETSHPSRIDLLFRPPARGDLQRHRTFHAAISAVRSQRKPRVRALRVQRRRQSPRPPE